MKNVLCTQKVVTLKLGLVMILMMLLKNSLNRFCKDIKNVYMRGSEFEFDGVNLLYYDFNKISLNKGGSYIESPKWIKNKKSTINPTNNDYKSFQYAVTVALNHDKIKKDPQRVSKIKPFIDQCNWNDIDFPSTGKDWKKLNNESIALNILYMPHKTRKIHLAYKSKHNLTREKQVILLAAVTRLSGLLRGVAGNNNGDFYRLNCFHAYRTENKLEKHKKICENHDYCHVEMPNEDHKIIKYNQGEKSIRSQLYSCHYTGKYRGAAHNICNLRYKTPKEISIVFHNGSTYDYHFIIKELAKEFNGNFECLSENTEKYITFSVPIKKEIENKNKIIEITYKIKFIDSFRFMSTSLSKLVDNLSEGPHNNKCVDCKSCLDYMITKDEKLIFRCFTCKKNYEKEFNKELIKSFANTYNFCDNDLNKFILLLRKGVYPYEYMDNWEKFDETSLPNKKSFYSSLNMENIDDTDYRHGNNVFKKFKLKNLGEYHDLYVQSDTLLLTDVFANFRNMCIKVYELDPAHFLSLQGLSWQACLKKANVELEL